MPILILGGTTEARQLASELARRGDEAIYSYAGRTRRPVEVPLVTRVGGFGGVAGLVRYLTHQNISHVVDATHPFAAQMKAHLALASQRTGIPALSLQRPAWVPEAEDRWTCVPSIADAPAALPSAPQRVFLAIGQQNIHLFRNCAEHHFLLRLVDPPTAPIPLTLFDHVQDRGPFTVDADRRLLIEHGISWIVAKNSGGNGARSKLVAARQLGVPVVMIERPRRPDLPTVETVDDVMQWLDHGAERGV